MKVLKFGGTSVGSAEALTNVKEIVSRCEGRTVVVVSALGGLTDTLIATAGLAKAGDASYLASLEKITCRHHDIIDRMIGDEQARAALLARTDEKLGELRSLYQGVNLIRDVSDKTIAAIVSYGERLSSDICATLVGAELLDSRDFIKTVNREGRVSLDSELTYSLIEKAFEGTGDLVLVPGFISTDSETGEVTNLGRGGSDYTASLIAAALGADSLEIWTDVDGFLTADPHMIENAYTINELSYNEATELCNFGAKVVYPPTIYPVCVKNIPIYVKNTFNPKACGTVICANPKEDKIHPVKGISSIGGISVITVSGLSMVGVIGVNRRIFSCLAANGISVFMVCQASSESTSTIGVRSVDVVKACEVLDAEFEKEIKTGSMNRMCASSNLASIAVVGDNMKNNAGIAGKLFGTLGRNGISIIACAQGASETNISFIVEEKSLRKALHVIHESFFLSEYKVLNLFLCGVGTVGGSLLQQIASQKQRLMKERSLMLNVVGIANSHAALIDRDGLEIEGFRERLAVAEECDLAGLKEKIISLNLYNSVFVDCTASEAVASIYQDLFDHNISVVTANKIAASSDYDHYRLLKDTARKKGVKFLFETNVGAGLPIINTINDLINSGDRILKIEAVLSGTLNFIFNTISGDVPFSETVRLAKEKGFSEPDPRIDLSGKDVIRKLVILSRESGYRLNQEDVEKRLFIPEELFTGSIDEFWAGLPALNHDFEERRRRLQEERKCWRFVAKLEDGRGSVELREIPEHHPFFDLDGSNNILLLTTERYRQDPMLIQGYGAGASVTAAGVFADIMSIANI
ncbi:MAG: bifunctional aspartate kinase/homoserine dehydrogenase I [Bacteroidales bacterium]|nr:bifunctional aspartate kinase/homoserine dehydrogenase I [Bacteroidales bacterium]